jgi:DNA-binding PadR family transcriptional regulator
MGTGGVEHVILGALSFEPMSGYEIKQLVDKSTRFFWAASYGQIYPALRRLRERGLVEASEQPQGGRRRVVYRLTPAGSQALVAWLREPPPPLELREEGLLKLFFAGTLEHDEALTLVRSIRASWEETLARLREVERTKAPVGFPALVLDFGIGMKEWMVEWSHTAEHRLQNEIGGTR